MPKSKGKTDNYPDRVYFCKTLNRAKSMIKELSRYTGIKDYTILKGCVAIECTFDESNYYGDYIPYKLIF